MKALSEASGLKFEWFKPREDDEFFEMVAAGDTYGSLEVLAGDLSVALARTAEGEWIFLQTGHGILSIQAPGGGREIGQFRPGFLGHGHLAIRDGADFSWKPVDFQGSAWGWHDLNGMPVMLFHKLGSHSQVGDPLLARRTMELRVPPTLAPKVALLSCLGWYLKVMHLRRAPAPVEAALAER